MHTLTRNYYEVLEVATDADQESIERVFRRLALMFHPDLNQSVGATLRMQEINEAYSTLRRPDKRAKYDREHDIRPVMRPKRYPEQTPFRPQKYRVHYSPPPPAPPAPEPAPRPVVVAEQVVLFYLGHSSYGMRIQNVEGILMMQPIIPSLRTPGFAEGIILARGEQMPVIDLRRYFGIEQQPVTRQSRIILGNVLGIKMGLIVDSVENYITIPAESIEPSPVVAPGQRVPFIRGIYRKGVQLVVLLDLPAMLSPDELNQLRRV